MFFYIFFILPSGKLLSSQSLIEKLTQSFRFFFQYFQDIFVKMACVLGGVAELIGFLAVVHDVEAGRGLADSFDPLVVCFSGAAFVISAAPSMYFPYISSM